VRSSVTRVTAAAATDVGRVREGNEDSFYAGHRIFAVADGMGGHRAGEVASALALEPVAELEDREFDEPTAAGRALVSAIETANRVVVERSQSDDALRGMGTTLTAVLVHGDELLAAHVGDSRAYLLRPGEGLSQLTTDHTLV
jgi:PPM family protein phosphatase